MSDVTVRRDEAHSWWVVSCSQQTGERTAKAWIEFVHDTDVMVDAQAIEHASQRVIEARARALWPTPQSLPSP